MTIQAQFDKAVSIVQNLPKNGPVRPTQEDQLYVRCVSMSPFLSYRPFLGHWNLETDAVFLFFS